MSKVIAHMQAELIRITGHPLSPIVLEELYGSLKKAGNVFMPLTNKRDVERMQKKLMKNFVGEQMDRMAKKPEFVVALCIMLSVALTHAVPEITKPHTPGTRRKRA